MKDECCSLHEVTCTALLYVSVIHLPGLDVLKCVSIAKDKRIDRLPQKQIKFKLFLEGTDGRLK